MQSDSRFRKVQDWVENIAQSLRDELQSDFMQEWLMELYITHYLRLEEVLKDDHFAQAPGLRNAFHHENADEFSSFVLPKRLGPRVCKVSLEYRVGCPCLSSLGTPTHRKLKCTFVYPGHPSRDGQSRH